MTGSRRMGIAEIVYALLVAGLLAALLGGCVERQMMIGRQDLDKGLVIVLPGIDGRAPHNETACEALRAGGAAAAVELYDWTAPLGALFNQLAIGRNREMAGRLARRIVAYRRAYPGCPVSLVGHSGGTAIAVWAAAALPEGEQVEAIVLLASSLSPGYDLSPALRRSRKGVANFWSQRDAVLLGLGTSLIGTMDGRHCEAAGKTGFHEPAAAAPPGAYAKLVQIKWHAGAAENGHDGGHFSCLARRFIAASVGPLVTSRTWDPYLVATVRDGARPGGPASVAMAESN